MDSTTAKGLQTSAQPPALGLRGLLFVVAVVAIVFAPGFVSKAGNSALPPSKFDKEMGHHALCFYVLVIPKLRYTK